MIEAADAAHIAVDGANGYTEIRSCLVEDRKEKCRDLTHIIKFWKALELDVALVEKRWTDAGKTETSATVLSKFALWLGDMPSLASKRWAELTEDLPRDEG